MDFIKNYLSILTTIVALIISGIFNIYQFLENKRLKKYATEKDLKRREASLDKLRDDYSNNKKYNFALSILGEDERKENEFKYRERCLVAEIEYLKKILKIKK